MLSGISGAIVNSDSGRADVKYTDWYATNWTATAGSD